MIEIEWARVASESWAGNIAIFFLPAQLTQFLIKLIRWFGNDFFQHRYTFFQGLMFSEYLLKVLVHKNPGMKGK